MVAKTQLSAGDVSVSGRWSPAGVPTSGDTVSSTYEMIVPTGYTWNPGAISMTGSGDGARSKLTLQTGAIFNAAGDITGNTWNDIEGQGTCTLNMNDYSIKYDEQSGSGVHNMFRHTGAGTMLVISNSNSSSIGGPSGGPIYGLLDVPNTVFVNINVMIGGGWYPGHHLRMSNTLILGGYFSNDLYSNPADDWIMDNVCFRNCITSRDVDGNDCVAEIRCRPQSEDTQTGTKRMRKVTFSSRNLSSDNLAVRAYSFMKLSPENVYFDRMKIQNLDYPGPAADWTKLFVNHRGTIGDFGSTHISNAYILGDGDNPKPFWNCDGVFDDWVIEQSVPIPSYDAGDYWSAVNGRIVKLNRAVIIDGCGSGIFNALTSDKTGTYEMNNCTMVVTEMQHPTNGMVRNEGSGRFDPAARVSVGSSIYFVKHQYTGVQANNRVFNMETAGNDQIYFFDNNAYCNVSSNPATVYFQLTSATKGSPGSQAGWGLNDWINPASPAFIDIERDIEKWGNTKGISGYENAILYLINGINGFNPATSRLEPGLITGFDVQTLLDYVRYGMSPTNSIYATSGIGGTPRGAMVFVPVKKQGGLVGLGLGIGI